jgi:hypothetical protein
MHLAVELPQEFIKLVIGPKHDAAAVRPEMPHVEFGCPAHQKGYLPAVVLGRETATPAVAHLLEVMESALVAPLVIVVFIADRLAALSTVRSRSWVIT